MHNMMQVDFRKKQVNKI